jgi:hypothetical protein
MKLKNTTPQYVLMVNNDLLETINIYNCFTIDECLIIYKEHGSLNAIVFDCAKEEISLRLESHCGA